MSGATRNNRALRIATVVALACVAAVAVGIFVLTEQTPEATSAESSFVNEWLVRTFGGVPGLYDAQRELWLGIHVRHWAHVVEFGALGLFVSLSALLLRWGKSLFVTGFMSVLICLALSLFDQCHKLFVPGRHFDWFDLAMDALGYGLAILVVVLIAAIATAVSAGPSSGRGSRSSP